MALLQWQRVHPGWSFWFKWMLGGIAGVVLLLILSFPLNWLMVTLPGSPESQSSNSWVQGALQIIGWIEIGLCLGLGQWLILRGEFKGAGWWVLATTAGYPLGLWASSWLPILAPVGLGASIPLATFGLALGILQWLVLRGRVLRAGWWILISVAGWLLAFVMVAAAELSGLYVEPFDMLAAFLFPAAVDGAGLVWLMQNKK